VTSRNVGVYYIPHEDTDTEQESKRNKTCNSDPRSADESSDDEWTYKNLENCSVDDMDVSGNENSPNDKPALLDDDNDDDFSKELRDESKKVLDSEKLEPGFIQQLVDKADELVQTTPKRAAARKKCSATNAKVCHNEQVREWLRKCQQTADDYNTVSSSTV